ncbi:MAG: biopolymer transporter ExbD [Candidatus Coatesbacteria bacterium]|nr:biopolymer transporter ExbD [Candidatus Coatesbacteria bacterium]
MGKKPKRKLPVLRMTSMMDMFTIFLVYLLINFSTDPESAIGSYVKLPDSNSQKKQEEKERERTISIGVVKNSNMVEVIASYKTDKIYLKYPYSEKAATAEEKDQLSILTEFLQKHTKLAKKIVIFEGDKNLPYRTLWAVLGSARDAGNIDAFIMSVVSVQ